MIILRSVFAILLLSLCTLNVLSQSGYKPIDCRIHTIARIFDYSSMNNELGVDTLNIDDRNIIVIKSDNDTTIFIDREDLNDGISECYVKVNEKILVAEIYDCSYINNPNVNVTSIMQQFNPLGRLEDLFILSKDGIVKTDYGSDRYPKTLYYSKNVDKKRLKILKNEYSLLIKLWKVKGCFE